jgi:hypothetical protein
MGMSMGPGEGPTRIPEPGANFRVRLTDQDGSRVELTYFAIDGQAFFMGAMGQGQIAAPLQNVKDVSIRQQDGVLKARLELIKGDPVELKVKGSLEVTGKTSFGNYRIPLAEVSRIEILGRAKAQP